MTRLLLIDARVLTPNRDGGSLRMVGLIAILQSLDVDVTFVPSFPLSFPPFDATLAEDTAALLALGVHLPPEGTTVDEHLRLHGHRYDIVMLTGTFVASRHFSRVRELAPNARVIFDTIDLHFLREYRLAKLTGNAARVQSALKIKRIELALARAADFTLVVTDRERTVLAEQDPPIQAWVVPMAHAVHPAPPAALRRDLVFLGAFSFDPNADAMRWFVHEILPALRDRLPDVRLHIIGSDPTPEVLALASDAVHVAGFVTDVADSFDRARVFVAPLRYGAGMKTKLLLALARGLPVVASPIAAEGIPMRDGVDVLIAHQPDQWIDRIVRLYEDAALWERLSMNGRALVEAHYSVSAMRARVEALLSAVAAAAPKAMAAQ